MTKLIAGVIVALGVAALVLVISLLFALPVMWCWNYVMPALFGVKVIGFWQAFVLNLLCGFLFRTSASTK